jgi:hypothetical protein
VKVADISEIVAEALTKPAVPKYNTGKALYKPEMVDA